MENQNVNNSKSRKITIKTPQGEIDIVGDRHEIPGVCPYCHKPIPLRSIVFKKEGENGTEILPMLEKRKMRQYKLRYNKRYHDRKDTVEFSDVTQYKAGECPYCHKQIPVREIIFKKSREQKD